jgi:hypothetical protein
MISKDTPDVGTYSSRFVQKLSFILLLLSATKLLAEERLVTLVVNWETTHNAAALVTNQTSIQSYESAELLYLQGNASSGSVVDFIKDDVVFSLDFYSMNNSGWIQRKPVAIAGPAVVRLRTTTAMQQSFCTLKISPASFPPSQTLIIPPGTNQVSISLECSTNLLSWLPATNGLYSDTNSAKFFRIKAQPMP